MKNYFVLMRFEFQSGLRGPLFWIALICLLSLSLPIRMAYGGEFVLMGRAVDDSSRLAVALTVGYSVLVFFTTLYALCLCLERAGFHYLKQNDILVLARSVGRIPFYAAKISAAFLNAMLYGTAGLLWMWVELTRIGVPGGGRLFLLALPLALNLACVIAVYFALRNFLGNFLIFFVWLAMLPALFLTGLLHAYVDSLKAGLKIFLWLPQLGGLHAWALGVAHPALARPDSAWTLFGVAGWTVFAACFGAWVFGRKRL